MMLLQSRNPDMQAPKEIEEDSRRSAVGWGAVPRLVFFFALLASGCLGDRSDRVPSAKTSDSPIQTPARHRIRLARPNLGELYGRIFGRDTTAPVMDQKWVVFEDPQTWAFDSHAGFWIRVDEAEPTPIALRLYPRATIEPEPLSARWEGNSTILPLVLDSSNRPFFEARFEAGILEPGLHHLLFERTAPVRAAKNGATQAYRIDKIEFSNGGPWQVFECRRREAYRQFQQLTTLGTTPISPRERLGGFLFDGPQTMEAILPQPVAAQFRVRCFNGSQAPAHFFVGDRNGRVSVDVPPGRTVALQYRVTEDGSRGKSATVQPGSLFFGVEGEPEGMFLWGTPILEPMREPSSIMPPPIILITLDTARKDYVAPYDSQPQAMPRLREFAGSSSVFHHAYSTSPWTLPSHASIFTGLYPSAHGAGVRDLGLDGRHRTLAEWLTNAGYLAAGFSGGPFTSSRRGMAQGFAVYHDPGDAGTETADILVKEACEFVAAHQRSDLFLFLNLFDPHFPYSAPPSIASRFGVSEKARQTAQLPGWDRVMAGHIGIADYLVQTEARNLDPIALDFLRSAYRAELAFVDEQLGILFSALKEQDLFDRALIIVTSDHGEFLGEGGLFFHSYRLDPVLTAIPLLIKWPHQRIGDSRDNLASLVDLFPTILSQAGVAAPASHGIALAKGSGGNHEFVIMEEHHLAAIHPLENDYRKIDDHLFAIQTKTSRSEFWRDRNQCAQFVGDVWQPSPCTTSAQGNHTLLQAFLPTTSTPSAENDQISSAELEKLRSLGYVK